LLTKFIPNPKKVALISDKLDTFQMQQKITGFREFISEIKGIEVIGPLKIDHKDLIRSIQSLEKDLLEVDGIYVACGALADVTKELKSMNFKKYPKLIGHDMNQDIYSYLKEETVTATICQNAMYQGYLAVKSAFNNLMLENEDRSSDTIIKLEIVTKSNAKYYV
jgi:LacI family transcriptional regulator